MSTIKANVRYIEELEFSKFHLPPYQRPYRWQEKNVYDLLDCLRVNMDKSEYRIGSIILHSHTDKDGDAIFDVVDGQQRLTTLSLLFKALQIGQRYILDFKYRHDDSKKNIYKNYYSIQNWLELNDIEKSRLAEFVLEHCSVVQIETDNLSEAFQMFDSQNGRGKPLEAYNLLKAFHIRAIDESKTLVYKTIEKVEIDRKWETAVAEVEVLSQESLLKFMMNVLYRVRVWSRNHVAFSFNKKKIKEFKGIQIHNGEVALPLENLSLLIYQNFEHIAGQVKKRVDEETVEMNPYVGITMPIVNGSLFFEFVQTFVNAYRYLFVNESRKEGVCQFQAHFSSFCVEYPGAYRQGDKYVREVYIALCLAVFDKFGMEGLLGEYRLLYALAYRKRLEQSAVYYETMAKYPLEYFAQIAQATSLADLSFLANEALKPISCVRIGGCEEIVKYLLTEFPTLKIIVKMSEMLFCGKKYTLDQQLKLNEIEYEEK